MSIPVKTMVKTHEDIGPEFNFTVKVCKGNLSRKMKYSISQYKYFKNEVSNNLCFKVSTGNFPVSHLHLNIALPTSTKGGNPLLYVTRVDTQVSACLMVFAEFEDSQ